MPMPTYILMAGLPGTGKSTLAEALARELNGVVLSKDAVRAALFPGPLTDYTREQDDLCFGMVLDAASYLARRNATEFIFLDGRTFSRSEQIEQAIRAAGACGLCLENHSYYLFRRSGRGATGCGCRQASGGKPHPWTLP
jgi:predicted kinase